MLRALQLALVAVVTNAATLNIFTEPITTRAEVVVPTDLNQTHPNQGDSWSKGVVTYFQQDYLFTILGGTGEGHLWFEASVSATEMDWGHERMTIYSNILEPIYLGASFMESGQFAPNSCFWLSCSTVPFTYGVSQVLSVSMFSSASYDWYRRWPVDDSGSIGMTFASEGYLKFSGVYDLNPEEGWTLNENAQIHSTVVPEPGTMGVAALALAVGVMSATRKRKQTCE